MASRTGFEAGGRKSSNSTALGRFEVWAVDKEQTRRPAVGVRAGSGDPRTTRETRAQQGKLAHNR